MKHRHIAAYLRLTTCGALLATCASCSDFLEPDNKSGREAEAYFTTAEGVESLLVNAYAGMKPTATATDIEEWGADLYIPTRKTDDIPLNSYSLTADNGDIKTYYAELYNMVNKANCLLKYASNNPDNAERYSAEAKFIRAYSYYKLLQHFGSVPWVEAYIETATRNYPKAPLADLYSHLEEDLQSCLDCEALPDEGHEGRISKQAANALLAKVCLEAAWDLGSNAAAEDGATHSDANEWAKKAKTYADAAIGGRQLTMSFEDKWSYLHQHNEEVIFALQYTRGGYPGKEEEGGHNLMFQYAGYYGTGSKGEGIKYGNSMMCPSLKGIYLWEKGDARYEATFMTTIYNAVKSELPWTDGTLPTQGYFAYYNPSVEREKLPIALRFFPWWTSREEAEAEFQAHPKAYEDHSADPDPDLEENPKAKPTKTSKKTQAFIQGSKVRWYTFSGSGAVKESDTNSYAEQNKQTENNQPVRKMDDPLAMCIDGDAKTCYREVVVLHLSDMYLTRAEANYLLGDEASALADVNATRQRAGLAKLNALADYKPGYLQAAIANGNAQPTFLDLILDEKARECWAERNRWTDLRRTRQLQRYNTLFNVYAAHPVKWHRPIPAGEIVSNEGMTDADQNPGY